MACPVCAAPFTPTGRRRYCSNNCRAAAHRRRHQPDPVATAPVPAAGQRRAATIYECGDCGNRALGEQRCDNCSTFMTRVGYGGLCPGCQEPTTIEDLLAD